MILFTRENISSIILAQSAIRVSDARGLTSGTRLKMHCQPDEHGSPRHQDSHKPSLYSGSTSSCCLLTKSGNRFDLAVASRQASGYWSFRGNVSASFSRLEGGNSHHAIDSNAEPIVDILEPLQGRSLLAE